MKFTSSTVVALLAVIAAATPTPVAVEKRAVTLTGTWGSVETGGFVLYHNDWGAASATSGLQTTTFDSLTDGSLAWSTRWTWVGGYGLVKSYSNVAKETINKKIAEITSLNSVWTWRYSEYSNMVSDVSYDIWLAPSVGADHNVRITSLLTTLLMIRVAENLAPPYSNLVSVQEYATQAHTKSISQYEIMIWPGVYGGAAPITSTGKTIGTPTIAGTQWNLYTGPNGDTTVFSFIPSGSNVGDFSADLKLFLNYLTSNQNVATSNVVDRIQAGTEPFEGSNALFTTYKYTLTVV
ncbi:xyloglucan-specific endo-beta-1,4-glucanase A [Diplocarpon rosae]|nr:xyloglucan-specific endo-beta-1,4-glucanase A [Diplocarpon rosae]